MYIEAQFTPNPAVMKFKVDNANFTEKELIFDNRLQDGLPQIIQELFSIESIVKIFVNNNFISIEKDNKLPWECLQSDIITIINNAFLGEYYYIDAEKYSKTEESNKELCDIGQKVEELLDSHIRHFLEQDGGNIQFHSFDEVTGTVVVTLQGACSGCPSSTTTIKDGVERILTFHLDEVKAVEAI